MAASDMDEFPRESYAYVAFRAESHGGKRIYSTPVELGRQPFWDRLRRMKKTDRAPGATPIGKVLVARYELVEVKELDA